MTLEEAIELTKTAFDMWEREWDCGEDWSDVHEARDMAISALEKQIPKKLIAEGDGYADGFMVYDSFYCPSCDCRLEEDEVEDYCPNCGQKITLEGDE